MSSAMPTQIIDNLEEGDEIDCSVGLFALFETQLKQHYFKPAVQPKAEGNEKGEHHDD